jgi:hypothetical protein
MAANIRIIIQTMPTYSIDDIDKKEEACRLAGFFFFVEK